MHTNPGFIWVPLKLQSDFGILIFSNLLSMTPGTLTVDLSGDKKKLLVHFLYNNEKDEISFEINKIQDKILKLTS
jgi:multisubunit Na+/H+ antiporter MnhE subunit